MDTTSEKSACPVCNNEAKLRCGGCSLVFYCSKEHQKKHWTKHKNQCKPYKILHSSKYGRYLVATRNLEAGDIVMQEFPFLIGPKQATIPVCLGCYTAVDGSYLCSKCCWPLCGPECETSKDHIPECEATSSNGVSMKVKHFFATNPMYECVTPLRCLHLKTKSPDLWNNMKKMDAHMDKRVGTDLYRCNQNNIVNYLKKVFKLDLDDDEVQWVCGILDVNTFEIKEKDYCVRGMYPYAYLMMHQCIPNTVHTFNNREIIVRASRAIRKGEPITGIYTHTWQSTMTRRDQLRKGKYFDCDCDRCADPTEFGTFFSAMKCSQCSDETPVVSLDPLNDDSNWKCTKCGFTVAAEQVRMIDQTAVEELENLNSLKGDLVMYNEQFIEKYHKYLYKSHGNIISAKHNLLLLYGRCPGYSMEEMDDEQLKKKEMLCREVLNILDVIDPGLTRTRGSTLYELHRAIVEQATRARIPYTLDQEEFKQEVYKAVDYLKESTEALALASPTTPEYQFYEIGLIRLKELQNVLAADSDLIM